jgi:hypothetical protein
VTAKASRPTLRRAAAPVPSDRGAPVGILARLDPDDLHPARLAGPHAWHPWQLTTRPPDPGDLRLILPPRYPNQRAGHLLDHLADRLDQPIWPPQPALTIQRNRHVLHAHDTTGWQATIRVDPALEVGGARGRVVVVIDLAKAGPSSTNSTPSTTAATTSTLATRPARTSPTSPTGSAPLRPDRPTCDASQLLSTAYFTSRPAPRPKPPAGSPPSSPPPPQTARSTPTRSDTSTTGCNTRAPQQPAVHGAGSAPRNPCTG